MAQSRRRHSRFFLCGLCNVVSIAENTSHQENAREHYGHEEKEKFFVAVRESRNEDKHTVGRSTFESRLNLSSEDEESEESQEMNQSLPQGTVACDEEGMKIMGCIRKKICLNAGEDLENMNYKNEGDADVEKDSIDSCSDKVLPRTSHNVLAQRDSISRPVMLCKDKMTIDSQELNQVEKMENEKDKQKQGNSAPKSTESQILEQDPSLLLPTTKKLMGRSKQASKLPEIKINDTLMKPAWIEEQPTSPGNRWKRVVALKVKVKKGQRIHRDSATINEEYELMIENLKQYGVL